MVSNGNKTKKAAMKATYYFLWAETESNRRHKDFQSFALPTELSALQNLKFKNKYFPFNLKNEIISIHSTVTLFARFLG